MNVAPELAISTLVMVASVGVTFGILKTEVREIKEDVKEVKKKVFNGAFVRRGECHHCSPLEDISDD